ncbi:hypothetical protein [Acidithrix ferrooxidans]|uniref:Uncharacterized protein n=1 Tax=Acidithrix ferrooxidans TaxID=1280514 RepID=A0A0D8HLW0_9ACTN|nr:hypothetical protein [Acidithrix ferrooxidans]KJF18752.1 hypothetical protein AXFE_03610 [Acidithrix ferrooxidans]CAG4931696.1 unnamed protein product [Acidithrix sp. C25]
MTKNPTNATDAFDYGDEVVVRVHTSDGTSILLRHVDAMADARRITFYRQVKVEIA